MSDRPAASTATVERIGEGHVVLGTAAVEAESMVFVRVPAGRLAARAILRSIDVAAIIATRRQALQRVPTAAAVQRARVAAKPVVACPPAVRVIDRGAVAVALVAELVGVCTIAVGKVAVPEVGLVGPVGLRHYAAEPARATTVDWAVQMRRLHAFRLTSGREWARAATSSR